MSATWKALDQATSHFHRETGFADPAWTRDREQVHILTQQAFVNGRYLLPPPHQPVSLHGKIRRPGLHLLNWLLREAVANSCKFPCEISSRDVALVGFFCQAPLDRPTQRSGRVRVLPCDR